MFSLLLIFDFLGFLTYLKYLKNYYIIHRAIDHILMFKVENFSFEFNFIRISTYCSSNSINTSILLH